MLPNPWGRLRKSNNSWWVGVVQIAKKAGKSAAAVMIRWGIQRGYIVIPSAAPLLLTSNHLVPCQALVEAQTLSNVYLSTIAPAVGSGGRMRHLSGAAAQNLHDLSPRAS